MRWHVVHCFTLYAIWIQMNIQRSLILELMLYEIKLHHNVVEATKKIIVRKVRAHKKPRSDCKSLDNKTIWVIPKALILKLWSKP